MRSLRTIALPFYVVVFLLLARQVHADLPQVPVAVDYTEDYRNTNVVVQHVQHIFIGKVIGQVGNAQLSRIPETQTSVRVLYNLKGHLTGAVTIDWFGSGYTPGTTYLFAASLDQTLMDKIGSKDPIYVLIDPQSTSAVISWDASLSDKQLIALAEANEKVLALRRAISSSASKTLLRYISLALFSIALLSAIILIRKRNPVRSAT